MKVCWECAMDTETLAAIADLNGWEYESLVLHQEGWKTIEGKDCLVTLIAPDGDFYTGYIYSSDYSYELEGFLALFESKPSSILVNQDNVTQYVLDLCEIGPSFTVD